MDIIKVSPNTVEKVKRCKNYDGKNSIVISDIRLNDYSCIVNEEYRFIMFGRGEYIFTDKLRKQADDFYLDEENVYKRLLTEYEKYDTLIVAVDYDGTINDFHDEGLSFDSVIKLLQDCNELGFKLVIYTANDKYDEIQIKCDSLGIEIDGINKQLLPQFEGRGKLYYNILLDDRAGLVTSYKILRRLVDDKS